ncbi:sugar-binding protein [Cohnella zeiphila]|uniref:Ig-like domain-containing protein n=1 Tax=Cohnella zeiphila TaxID=2761120 RepID=A0A7X0SM56_9BACL|nr:sugar-binding protein [Cohnella zeiphila]MBB6731369.1 hypothetical protein [Cohnella zeiphila]
MRRIVSRIVSCAALASLLVGAGLAAPANIFADEVAPQPGSAIVTVDKSMQYQRIEGFGGFGGNKPGWEAGPYYNDDFLNLLVDDLGLTIVRDEVVSNFEQEKGDWNIDGSLPATSCQSQTSPLSVRIDYLKALKQKADAAGQPLKIIASVWSPPYWMKYVKCIFGQDVNWNKLIMSEIPSAENPNDYKEEYAQWLIQYVKVMKEQAGVDIYAISVANEPAFGEPYQSAVYTTDELARVIKYVGERFKQEGLQTKIFGPEDVQTTDRILSYMNAIGSDEGTRQQTDFFAVHGYGPDGASAPNANIDNWTRLNDAANTYNKELWMTETSGYSPDWSGAMALAKSITLALKHGKVSAWVYWSLADHENSEFNLISDDGPNPNYYASKQFYKYIRPGAVGVDSNSSDPELLSTSFVHRENQTLTTVLVNTGSADKTVTLQVTGGSEPASYQMIRSSQTEQAIEAGTVRAGQSFTVPAQSIVTLIGTTAAEDDPVPPAIRTQPVGVAAGEGGTAQFSVDAVGTPDLSFQWQRNGQDLPGETGRKLFVKSVSEQTAGTYAVKVSSPYGSVTSDPAVLSLSGFDGIPIARTAQAPAIDGTPDPAWDNAEAVPLAKNVIGQPSSPDEFSGTVKAMWDADRLYYLYQIKDSTSDNPNDTTEAFLDLDNSKSQAYGADDFQFAFRRDNGAVNETKHNAVNGIEYKAADTADGYTIEASIPWSTLGFSPEEGTIIGADAASDDDLGGGNRYKIAFNTTNNDIWLNPSYMGVAKLLGGSTQPAADTKLTVDRSTVYADAGASMDVTVGAKDAADLYGFDVTLQYDKDKFDLVDVSTSPDFGTGDEVYFASQPVDGGVRLVGTLLGADAGKTGDLALAEVHLKAKMNGPVNAAVASGAEWSDSGANVHPFAWSGAALTNVTLQSSASGTLLDVGQTADLELGAANAADLYGFDATLTYDADQFEFIGASVSDEFAGPDGSVIFDSNPSAGKVRLIGTLKGDVAGRTADQLPLAHVQLKAKTRGKAEVSVASGATWTNSDSALLPFQQTASLQLIAADGDVAPPAGFGINDLAAVAKAFGLSSGSAGYWDRLDMNLDGSIDIVDIAYVANHLLNRL